MFARHYTTGGYAAAIFPLGEYGPLVSNDSSIIPPAIRFLPLHLLSAAFERTLQCFSTWHPEQERPVFMLSKIPCSSQRSKRPMFQYMYEKSAYTTRRLTSAKSANQKTRSCSALSFSLGPCHICSLSSRIRISDKTSVLYREALSHPGYPAAVHCDRRISEMASLPCLLGVLLLMTTSSPCTSQSSNPTGSPTTVTTAMEGSGTLSSGKTSQADSLNVQVVARAVRAGPRALH